MNPRHRREAEDLALRAMRTTDREASSKLAARALELDPTCVDAFVQMARLSCGTHGDLVEQIRLAVRVAERGLGGTDFFHANRGRFWTLPETRPYMRARAYLAQLLTEEGKIVEAIAHYVELLELDTNDQTGMRYHLLGCFFQRNDYHAVRRLLDQFHGEDDAVFAWANVLERLGRGHYEDAAIALREARRLNSHVEDYLTGRKAVPRRSSEQFASDEEREAVFCATLLAPVGRRRRKARAWLKRIT